MENNGVVGGEPSLCTLHSDDANHQAANLVNWDQQFDQLSHGRFLGVINEIHYPDVHVFREDTSHVLRQQCRVEDGGLWIGFSADNKQCRINNALPEGQQFLCRPGGLDFELLTPDDFSIFGLVLHRSLMSELEECEEEGCFSDADPQLWLEHISPLDLFRFREYLSILLNSEGNKWSSRTQQLILKDAIYDLLCQTKNHQQTNVSVDQRHKVMSKVKLYLNESALHSPITVSELCTAVHVSRRTLQNIFAQCCGMSPKQYISFVRLNQVRRALLVADQTQTVTDIAFDFGFFHLGQFGQDYKRLFGETPLQTLMRN
ncbi:helix-turn-helix domain-containing protein [Vibrio hannami]|uniref:helix-turn-helix domain-containing protein n=1 Tax=Vibrio hannami TaxID=2717094 RepID=UPI00240FD60D|nr:helix-turn-helix domain-containing protein [Vibrio hannami]MDG3087891.1 helix-turn-helix domain-containing protein [Vibrio hannami]